MLYNFQNTIYQIFEKIANSSTLESWIHVSMKRLIIKYVIYGKALFAKVIWHTKFEDMKSFSIFLQKCPSLNKHDIIQPESKTSIVLNWSMILKLKIYSSTNCKWLKMVIWYCDQHETISMCKTIINLKISPVGPMHQRTFTITQLNFGRRDMIKEIIPIPHGINLRHI